MMMINKRNNRKKMAVILMFFMVLVFLSGCSGEKTGLPDLINFYFNQKSGLPQYNGKFITDVDKPVDIYFDDFGIPHIVAENEKDLFFAQGFIHANDRLFQLDLMRRLIAGELAEIFGEDFVEDDKYSRTIGFRRAGEASLEIISPESKEILKAYAAGVNAYIEINRDNLPPEFILLNYEPEPWDPVDSISIGKMMAWYLGANANTELIYASLINTVGEDKARDLFPVYPDYGPVIIKPEMTAQDLEGALNFVRLSDLSGFTQKGAGIGSNSWVISGDHSASGGAMLSSDMHLTLSVPQIFYLNHLIVPGEFNVTGAMFPGVPGVVNGFNEYIAWAQTNLEIDVMDLYEIKFDESNPYLYYYDDELLEAEVINETINVRAGEDVAIEIVITHHGPVISPVTGMDTPYSLRWAGLDPTPEVEAISGLMKATNFEEFRETLQSFTVPAQNFMYADVAGNIGYLGNGIIPIRSESHEKAGNGLLPVPGWSSDYEWTGYVPWEEIPSMYNPDSGIIVTANNKVADDSYPYFLTYNYMSPVRAATIENNLYERSDLTISDMQDIQATFYNRHAEYVVPVLLQSLKGAPLNKTEKEAYDSLFLYNENPTDEVDSPGAAIFHRMYSLIIKNMLEELSDDLLDLLYYHSPFTDTIDALIVSGKSHWFEDRDKLVLDAFTETVAELREKLGSDVQRWDWGKIHHLTFKHYLGDNVSKRKYNRGPFLVGGSFSTPGLLGFKPRPDIPFNVYAAAPWRYVVDLADHKAEDIMAIGNSGHFMSPHYDDMMNMWLRMEYKPMIFDLGDVRELDKLLKLESK